MLTRNQIDNLTREELTKELLKLFDIRDHTLSIQEEGAGGFFAWAIKYFR